METFLPSRGIRQGDPISPYLFILCLEYLSIMIEKEVREGHWRGIQPTRNSTSFSHLFFTDDIILLGKADRATCGAMKKTLDLFCARSGQSINSNKSRVIFSKNTDSSTRRCITNMLGIEESEEIGKYLGFPMDLTASRASSFNFIVDKVKDKLSGWKANLISRAGRAVLINSVMNTIPNHVMQCTYLPQSTCKALDRLSRDFLWGSSEQQKKMHMIAWDTVTKPKGEGGLGIQRSRERNVALLGSMAWRANSDDRPWARLLRSKYSISTSNVRGCSLNRRALQEGANIAMKGVKWVMGTGQNVRFWKDVWIGMKPLREIVEGPLHRIEEELKVSDVLSEDGNWNLQGISMELPQEILNQIRATPKGHSMQMEDRIAWKYSTTGRFSTKSAYALACGRDPTTEGRGWEWIWKVPTQPRISMFLWMACHQKILTAHQLHSRGLNINPVCSICQNGIEDVTHVLRDCSDAIRVWRRVGIPLSKKATFSLPIYDWLRTNSCSYESVHMNLKWSVVFLQAIWLIWTIRNAKIFRTSSEREPPHLLILQRSAEFQASIRSQQARSTLRIVVRWTPHPVGGINSTQMAQLKEIPTEQGLGES